MENNGIGSALYEIRTIEETAERDRWVNRLHPLVKLFVTLFYIVTVVSCSRYDADRLFGMILYPAILFNLSDLSFREAVKRLRIVLPLVMVVGIFNPFFDRQTAAQIAGIPVSGGVITMCTLMLKGILTVLASYILIATTSIGKICHALRLLHVPKILVTEILLIYRYISVLLEEVRKMTQAYELRAPGRKGIAFREWGSFAGLLLLRSMDRANELYESMCLRGFRGEFYPPGVRKIQAKDVLYLLFWCIFLIILRGFPVVRLIGSLVVK